MTGSVIKNVSTRANGVNSCERCQGQYFRTLEKGRAWICRTCGAVRGVPSPAKIAELEAEMKAAGGNV